LSIAVTLLLFLDIGKRFSKPIENVFNKCLGPVLRHHETKKETHLFTGGTTFTISILICVLFFPKEIAITAIFVMIICDTAAAIIGKSFGKHFIKNKTFEGSAAFLLSGLIVILLTPKVTNDISEYYIGFLAILLTTLVELIPLRFDDNIFIPVFFGLVYTGAVKLFLA
jgi:dolichol kinase